MNKKTLRNDCRFCTFYIYKFVSFRQLSKLCAQINLPINKRTVCTSILLKKYNACDAIDDVNILFELLSLLIVCVHTCLIMNSFTLTYEKQKKNKRKLCCLTFSICFASFGLNFEHLWTIVACREDIFKCVQKPLKDCLELLAQKEC